MRCSEKQMQLLLDHVDSPYIRCIGFLYLRYAVDPTHIWRWIEPYVFDDEPVRIQFNPAAAETTVGSYVRSLFSDDLDYYGTRLPRLPIATERDLTAKLLQAQQVADRASKHTANRSTMDYFSKLGNRVRALYEDDENPLTWYDGVIDRVLTTDPKTGAALTTPKYIVTFTEYGNTETVTLGEMDKPGGGLETIAAASSSSSGGPSRGRSAGGFDSRRRDDDRRGGGYDRSNDRRGGTYDRDNGRRGFDDRSHNHRRNDDRSRGYGGRDDRRDRSRSREPLHRTDDRRERDGNASSDRHGRQDDRSPPRRSDPPPAERPKTREELAAIAAKKRQLMSKYG